ncbi:low molecular weight protein-tyrosine-phosphatase [Spirillospora sp. NPDC029432]|uniref:low molecular weight protein-tyrosine-phosphatase n=1 Tax=Spirillospora sp. NPDC029432 TaxID=3154599 RepID=UPI003455AAE0
MSYRVTFVCTGNICRSPMAEWVLRHHVEEEGLDVEVDSSGTGNWHVGDDADARTVQALLRAGYRSAHIARQFDADWFDRYDLIIALDKGHARALRAMAPAPGPDGAGGGTAAREKIRLLREFDPAADRGDLDVPDPYYGGEADFDLVLEQVEAAMPGLLDEIRAALKEG